MQIHSPLPMTLIGGGPCSGELLAQALALAPRLVAADGGADRALALDHRPEAVIGDMDSVSAQARAALPDAAFHHVAEQDSTDFDKALRHIAAPLVIGVGFIGARLDHTLAALSVLVARRDTACLLLSEEDVAFHLPPALSLDLPVGSRFSLYPLADSRGQSQGLRWPIDGLTMSPAGRIGTSNAVTGPVRLRMEGPGMVAITPRAALGEAARAVQDALRDAPARR